MTRKRIILIFYGITLVGVTILAMSISGLEFQPGERFRLPSSQETAGHGVPTDSGWIDVALIIARFFLGLSVILMPIFIIYLLSSRQGRQELIRLLPWLAVFAAILFIFTRLPLPGWVEEEALGEVGPRLGDEPLPPAPIAEFSMDTPDWLIILVAILLSLLLTGIVAMVYLNRRKKPDEVRPYERLVIEAEQALGDLYAGRDLRQTIIRCYLEMSLALDQQRGIRRDSDMTTHEFESLLQSKGLPEESIHELTRLFEIVRYGNHPLDQSDEKRAISSLRAVITALRSGQ
ncbi:MAG: DUF4129 domain-containing protein [Anaerolineaceae bacterium]|jgi:MFS family permease